MMAKANEKKKKQKQRKIKMKNDWIPSESNKKLYWPNSNSSDSSERIISCTSQSIVLKAHHSGPRISNAIIFCSPTHSAIFPLDVTCIYVKIQSIRTWLGWLVNPSTPHCSCARLMCHIDFDSVRHPNVGRAFWNAFRLELCKWNCVDGTFSIITFAWALRGIVLTITAFWNCMQYEHSIWEAEIDSFFVAVLRFFFFRIFIVRSFFYFSSQSVSFTICRSMLE